MSQTVLKTANLRAGNREAERKGVTLSLCSHTPAASHGGIRLRWGGLRQGKLLRQCVFSHHTTPQEDCKQASHRPGAVSLALKKKGKRTV